MHCALLCIYISCIYTIYVSVSVCLDLLFSIYWGVLTSHFGAGKFVCMCVCVCEEAVPVLYLLDTRSTAPSLNPKPTQV